MPPKAKEMLSHEPRLTKLQRYTDEIWPRSKISLAAWNPRTIGKHERAKLKKGLLKFGMVEAWPVSRKTGTLLGGHQRILIADEIAGNLDYSVKVTVHDYTEAEEKKLNILLNNKAAQGEYDEVKFEELLKGFGKQVDFDDMGLDRMDIEMRFAAVGSDISHLLKDEEPEEPAPVSSDLDELEKINALRRRRKEYEGTQRAEDDPRVMLQVYCRSNADRIAILAHVGLDQTVKYIDSDRMRTHLGMEPDLGPEPKRDPVTDGS